MSEMILQFTEAQIVFALRQADTGIAVGEVCRKMGISEATFYNWKKKFGGLGVSQLRRLGQLEEENQQLKKLADRVITIRVMPDKVSDLPQQANKTEYFNIRILEDLSLYTFEEGFNHSSIENVIL